MKHCPVCNIPLDPVVYTGVGVLRCGQCQGHLVDTSRLAAIKRIAGKSQAELKAEVTGAYHGDHTGPVKCPTCRMPMRKQPVPLPGLTLQLDVCKTCSLIWLDGGELALVQLDHRATPAFRDAQQMKQRIAALEADPARKAAFEQNMAKLPEEPDPLQDVLEDAASSLLIGNALDGPEAVIQLCLHLMGD